MKTLFLLTAFSVLSIVPQASYAEDTQQGFISLGAGYYDVLDNENSATFRLEYRTGYDLVWGIAPFVGFEATTDEDYYAHIGAYRDFDLTDQIFTTLSLAGGYYNRGEGPRLDHDIEFRSMVELGYKLNQDNKVSAGFSHISNAELGDHNPGSEALTFYYHRAWP